MKIKDLIKGEIPAYMCMWRSENPRSPLRYLLKLAKEQGVLPEICSRLGISLRSTQRWIPTPQKEIGVIKNIKSEKNKYGQIQLTLWDDGPPEYEIKKKKRRNAKRKALPFNKSIEHLLTRVLLHEDPIPDTEPTDKEIMVMLLKFKKFFRTWRIVSQELQTEEMILYRFRKTGKMKKCNRILFYMLLAERLKQPLEHVFSLP